jgi:hypothetical protein
MPMRKSKRLKRSSNMLESMGITAIRSAVAPLVAGVPIRVANRIVCTTMHTLPRVDVMCLKFLILYRMLIMRQ